MDISAEQWIMAVVLLIVIIFIFIGLNRFFSKYENSPIIDTANLNNNPDKYAALLLVLGIFMPLSECLIEIFNIRNKSELLNSFIFGGIYLTIYFLQRKNKWLRPHLFYIFLFSYILYYLVVLNNLRNGNIDIITLSEYCLNTILGYYIFNRFRDFIAFNLINAIVLMSFYLLGDIPLKNLVIYINISLTSFVFNYVKEIIDRHIKANLLKMEDIINKGSLLVININNKRDVVYIKGNLKAILGYDTADWIHKNWEKEILRQFCVGTDDFENGLIYTQKFIAADGTYKLIEWEDTLQNDTITKLGRDVTHLKEAEEQIFLQNKRMSAVLASSGDLSFIIDKELFIRETYQNERLKTFTNYNIFVNKPIQEIDFPENTIAIITKNLLTTLKTRKQTNETYSIRTEKGEEWFDLSVSVLSIARGEVSEVVAVIKNITEKKNYENTLLITNQKLTLLESFINHTNDALQVADNEGQLVYVNNISAERLGILPEEASRYNIGDFEPLFRDINNWYAHIDELKENNGLILEGQSVNKLTGTVIPVEVTVKYVIINQKGYVIASLRDISERKETAKQLEIALTKAESASKTKSEFLANMSHEIRTPLNGVIGFTDLLMNTELNDVQRQYMEVVYQSANSLLDTISDILDFSKIEAGKLDLVIERTDIFELTSQVIDVIRYQVHKKGLELLLNIPAETPRFIWADAIRIRQVLVNLLGNAVKFTSSGEIELKVITLSSNADKTLFRFIVRDTGIGIDEKNQTRIFEAFAQEDASTTKRFGGTGLGLAISNKLLDLMGSKLGLISELDKGSIFYFDIWLAAEQDKPIEWNDISVIKTALIVDDNANNRHIIRDMLAIQQIKSIEADSGVEALEILKKDIEVDVIIMDYNMPVLNGIETTRQIRALEGAKGVENHFILLYSSTDDGTIDKFCQELNIKQRLVKPVKKEQLFHSLSHLTIKKQSETASQNKKQIIHKQIIANDLPLKILIVEDNKVNILLAKAIFSKTVPNAEIFTALNGEEAITMFQAHQPSIIFMDIQMPVMNGYEATQAIRRLETNSHTPIIALTAGTVKGEKEKCLEAGMDDYIPKPIIQSTIEAIINKWIKQDINTTDNK